MKKVIGCSLAALLSGVIVSDAEGMKVRKGADVYVGGAQLTAVKQEARQEAMRDGAGAAGTVIGNLQRAATIAAALAVDRVDDVLNAGVRQVMTAANDLHAADTIAAALGVDHVGDVLSDGVRQGMTAANGLHGAADIGAALAVANVGDVLSDGVRRDMTAARDTRAAIADAADLAGVEALLAGNAAGGLAAVQGARAAQTAIADAANLADVERALAGNVAGGLAAVQGAHAAQTAIADAADLAGVEALLAGNVAGGLAAVQGARAAQTAIADAANLGAVEALLAGNVAGGLAAVQGARAVQDAVAAAADLNALAALGGLQPAVVRALEVVPLRTYGDNLLAIANNAGHQQKAALIKGLQTVADEYIGDRVNNGLLAAIIAVEGVNDTSAVPGGATLDASYGNMNGWDLGNGVLNLRNRAQVIEDIMAVGLNSPQMGRNANEILDTHWHLIRVIAEIAETGQVGDVAVADAGALGYTPEVIRALAKVVNGF